jgi:hypothetical protein
MFRLLPWLSSILLALSVPVWGEAPERVAPNLAARAADQRVAAGNACGPTALLNAFRFGSPPWQRAGAAVGGRNDREMIFTIIRERGMRPSRHLNGNPRWNLGGVNLLDLCDIGNELAQGHFLPPLKNEVLFMTAGESQKRLLQRVHARMGSSMARGMPPVISLTRYVQRRNGRDGPVHWEGLAPHFITLTSLPARLPEAASSFPVTYVDPWGGRLCRGTVGVPGSAFLADVPSKSPCLQAEFPEVRVGRIELYPGETSVLTISAVIGAW